jgi:hypothetical protein
MSKKKFKINERTDEDKFFLPFVVVMIAVFMFAIYKMAESIAEMEKSAKEKQGEVQKRTEKYFSFSGIPKSL